MVLFRLLVVSGGGVVVVVVATADDQVLDVVKELPELGLLRTLGRTTRIFTFAIFLRNPENSRSICSRSCPEDPLAGNV